MATGNYSSERWWKHLFAPILYLSLALLTTWPLAQRSLSRLPIGSEPVRTVPMFNAWTIWWNADRLAHASADYWDAPIFFPAKHTFALSEPQPTTMIVAPIVWITGSRVLAYNIYLWLALTLNGWLTQLLLCYLRVRWPIAVGGGVAMLILPVIHWQLGVLQLVPLWGILWTLLALARILSPQVRSDQSTANAAATEPENVTQASRKLVRLKEIAYRGSELGFAFSLAFFTSVHHALFLALLMVASVWTVGLQLLRNAVWCKLLFGAILAAILTLPVVLRLNELAHEPTYTRPVETVEQLSLNVSDFGAAVGHTWLNSASADRTWWMSPGWLKLPLAIVGMVSGVLIASTRRWTLFLTSMLFLAFALSLGMHLKIFGIQPWLWLNDFVPGFAQVRSAFRFGYFVQIATVLLAAHGVDRIWGWGWLGPASNEKRLSNATAGSKYRRGLAIFAALWGIAAMSDPWPNRARLGVVPDITKHRGWIEKLALLRPKATLCLPMAAGDDVRDFESTTDWMMLATYHGIPLANGYSGFFPPRFFELRDSTWQASPTGELLEGLLHEGISVLVVDRFRYRVDWEDIVTIGNVEARRVYQDDSGIDLYQLTLSSVK